ncbi:hypothetical protein JYU34_015164 [Plutella xylostella]|uniref:G-protein coupled receptors family 1 profile domain-containing protein n=1 Tax=Plutella xylostella TaxID=51655 RepID=A0ABQ7Q6H0_PLUXY|nr:hypothetical protein JYU34_015164 [Plutella xylostella]
MSMTSLISMAILCNANATIVVLAVANFIYMPLKRHRNLCFHKQKHLSTVFLVFMWASLYASSLSLLALLHGVKRYSVQAYSLSPSNRPTNSPRSNLSLNELSLKILESWALPLHLATMSLIFSFESQTTCTYME